MLIAGRAQPPFDHFVWSRGLKGWIGHRWVRRDQIVMLSDRPRDRGRPRELGIDGFVLELEAARGPNELRLGASVAEQPPLVAS
jgi:hypothetical protein